MVLRAKKTKSFRSLWVTLALAFLALSLLVLLISSGLNMYLSYRTQQELITQQQTFIAGNAAEKVKDFIEEKLDTLRAVAKLSNPVQTNHQEQKLILEKLLGLEPAFRQAVLLDTEGQELASVSRLSSLVSRQLTERIKGGLFSEASKVGEYISSVYIDDITSEPMVIMAISVTNIFDDFEGTLLAEVNLKFMWDLVGRIKVGNNGLAYVVDNRGNLLAAGDISRVLRGENLSYLKEVSEFVSGNSSMHTDDAHIVRGFRGNRVVANHAHLNTPDWAVVVELPVLEAYQSILTTLIVSAFIVVVSFGLAIVFGVYLSKRITKPITILRDAAAKIGEGRLDTRIEIKKSNEIGVLAAAFNQMAQDLQGTTTSIEDLNKEIEERKKTEQRLLGIKSLQESLLKPIPIEQKFNHITDSVVRILDADFARIWVIKQGDLCDSGCRHAAATEGTHVCKFRDKCLHLVASAGRYTHINGEVHRRVPFGCYKIGRIAAGEDGKFLTNDTATDPHIHNHDWVKELGLVSFAGYRLAHTDGTPVGVLALFSKHPISEVEDTLLEGIAHATSMVINTAQTEEELRQNEEFTKRIVESSSDCIKVLDLQGNLLSMSSGGQKLLEIDDMEPYLNVSFIDFWKGEDRKGCLEAIAKAKQGETGVFYGYFETVKGKPKWWEVMITPIKDADGSINRLLAVSRDITERKKSEEELSRLLSLYTATLEATADGILVVDFNGRVVGYNKKYLQMWRIPEDLITNRDDDKLLVHILGQIEDPKGFTAEVRRLSSNINEQSFDIVRFKDGRVFERFSQPQRIKDRIVGRVWSFRDVTRQKKTEEDLQISEQRFKQVIECAGDWIWEIEKEGLFTYSSPVSTKVLGYEPNEIVGKKYFYDFFDPGVREELKNAAFKIFARRETFQGFVSPNINRNGETVILETNGTPIIDDAGNVCGYRGANRDISDRKKAEQRQTQLLGKLEKTNQELNDFVYIASHDLKTPLRGIATLANWLLTDFADKLNDDGREKINLLMTRVERMYSLIMGILRYSKMSRIGEEKVIVDLNQLVTDIIDVINPPKKITITIENQLPLIKCERTPITQVFENLIVNAVKYMDKPKGWIKIGCVETDDLWKFSVADNGPGIEQKYFKKIFQIFQTLSPRHEIGSTGIGLSLVKKIVEMYGGAVWVDSELGKGSTFFFALPKQEREVKDERLQQASIIS